MCINIRRRVNQFTLGILKYIKQRIERFSKLEFSFYSLTKKEF